MLREQGDDTLGRGMTAGTIYILLLITICYQVLRKCGLYFSTELFNTLGMLKCALRKPFSCEC